VRCLLTTGGEGATLLLAAYLVFVFDVDALLVFVSLCTRYEMKVMSSPRCVVVFMLDIYVQAFFLRACIGVVF
jgi:hypothetical protein